MLRVASTTLLCALVCAIVVVALRKVGWMESEARASRSGVSVLPGSPARSPRMSSASRRVPVPLRSIDPRPRRPPFERAVVRERYLASGPVHDRGDRRRTAHAAAVDPARAAPLRRPRRSRRRGALGVVLLGSSSSKSHARANRERQDDRRRRSHAGRSRRDARVPARGRPAAADRRGEGRDPGVQPAHRRPRAKAARSHRSLPQDAAAREASPQGRDAGAKGSRKRSRRSARS